MKADQTLYQDTASPLKSETCYDGMGRVEENRQYETSSTYIKTETELLAFLAHRVDVEATIVVVDEDVLAVVAPLGGVMRNTLRYHAHLSRHVLARLV